MPPLPALRCSPGRERITENGHNWGQSFESGLTLKANDDDLVLFNEVQNQERDNFLLHTTDDFEDSLYFKIGINIPSSGKKSDLLNAEGDKNDYDWLLTPPETPLFPTLDDDDPQPVNPASRDRTRSQPIPISRSLTDKNYQTSRTSYSPQRLSPSSQSSVASAQMKGRSLSAPQSSPSIIRSITPTRRFSTPPNKPSIPAPRSSTPTLRRTSTSIQASNYGGRGPSPVKASRGDSASPKSRGWQMAHSGFNSDAPPNLRTSLSDRPLSHVRGSSPASRNGRESSMKLGGKLMSPTSSRSISSSYSQEQDHFSSCSKGSVAYSGDDDEEYLHSITVGISRSTPPRKDGILTNNKAMPFSRKPSRTSSNYVPKRSFNSAPRLMEQRRAPQSMFRPLLSSIPTSTFRPIFSRNSSLTTSSTASSEQGVISVAPNVEGGEHEQNDLSAGWERVEDFDSHEEAFLFNKVNDIIRETNDRALCGKHRGHDDQSKILKKKFNSNDLQNPIRSNGDVATSKVTFKLAHCADNKCDIDGYPIRVVCSKCGKEFNMDDAIGNKKLCQACGENSFCTALTSVAFTENEVPSQMDTVVMTLSKEGKLNVGEPEFHKDGNGRIKLNQHGRNIEPVDNFFQNTFSMQILDGSESRLSEQCLDNKKNIHVTEDCRGSAFQLSNHAVYPSLKVDVPENAGILVLLQQGSANTKWPILQGKSLSAANNLCSEPSYSRNNVNALRRSFGLDSSFTTSSIDLGLSKLTETYGQHHLSMNSEALDVERDIESFAGSLISDYDASTNCYEPRKLINEFDEKISSSIECLRYNSSQNLNHKGNNDLACSAADIIFAEECSSSINNDEDPQNSGSNVKIIERTSDALAFSELVEDHIIVNHTSQNVILDGANDNCSVGTTESHDGYIALEDGQNECTPVHEPPSEEGNEHTSPKVSENGISLCFSDSVEAVLGNGESAIMVEGPRRHQSRNLTLEEATDTILFCSSIIHDLAYKATTVALEKDQETLLEHYYAPPIVTIMENHIPGLREKSGKFSNKPMPRSHKFKRNKTEAQTKSPLKELNNENDVNIEEFTASKAEIPWKVDSEKPPKLESKCNCSVM